MEHTMRRYKQLLPKGDAEEILNTSTNGVLSLVNKDGEPYGVPLSFAFDGNNSIYFHSAVKGYKIECIGSNPLCSFCVIGQDRIVPEEFTTYFRSVIISGKIRECEGIEEIEKGLRLLCEKYSPGIDSAAEISKCISHVKIFRIDILDMTGKEAIELVRMRNKQN